MSTFARIAKNTASLAAGNLITKFLSLAFFVYVARRLGDLGFGRFSTATALGGLAAVLPNYIARPYLIRETARAPQKAGLILAPVALTNFVLSLLLFATLRVIAPHLGYHPDTVAAILILGFALVFDTATNSYHAALAGFERRDLSALLNIGNTLITVTVGGAVLWLGYGLTPLVLSYATAKFLTFGLALGMLRRVGAAPAPRFDPALMLTLLKGSWPFFVTTLFVMLYARLDIVMLSFFRPESEVGYYNAAYKVMEGLGLLSASFVTAIYPVLSRLFVDRPDRLREVYHQSLRYLVAFVLPAATGLALIADDLMPLLFGASFAPAATALAILVWGQALDGINPLLSQTLRATDRERSVAVITGIGAAINLVANLILIPPYGLYGAAIATVLSCGILLGINLWAIHAVVGAVPLRGPLLRTLAATLLMAGSLYYLSRWVLAGWPAGGRLALTLVAGFVLYPAFAWICGVRDAADRRLLLTPLRRRFAPKTPAGR